MERVKKYLTFFFFINCCFQWIGLNSNKMKKIFLVFLLSFMTELSYASPDRIGNGHSFFDSFGAILIGLLALPVLIVMIRGGLSDNEKEGKTTGCIALLAVGAFVLFVIVKCS